MTPQPTERTLWRETVRVFAVTFLLLACADLAFPQICGEDNEPLFPTQAAAAATFGHADDSDGPQPHPGRAEDCFCCCSHIVSEDLAATLSALAMISESDPNVSPTVPLPPAQLLFHPPRLA